MDYQAYPFKDFSYCLTQDLQLTLTLRISSLEGRREKKPFAEVLDNPSLKFSALQTSSNGITDCYVTCQLFADNKPLTVPIRTSYRPFKTSQIWNEWITIPIKYCHLPVTAQLAFTVWDAYGPRQVVPVGGTTFRLFGKNNTLRKGKHKLHLHPDRIADGGVLSSTPSKIPGAEDEMDRLEKLVKKHERGDMTRLDWLDNLTFREIEKINRTQSTGSKKLFLYIDLPKFDFPLVFSEPEYELAHPVQEGVSERSVVHILDPEIVRENPVEAKHRRLVRANRSSQLDRDLKPNAKNRDELAGILKYPPTQQLTAEEKDLLWKFRFYLTRNKKALTKFLKCVTWSDATEAKQAVELLLQWANIDIDDALELLGPNFHDRSVRSYAVKQLGRADDDELQLYLLQLVQALKFEWMTAPMSQGSKTSEANGSGSGNIPGPGGDPTEHSLAAFLIERAVRNPVLGNYFHWYFR